MANSKFINRRDFIFQSASFMSASWLALHGFSIDPFVKYKMGLQLFTVRGPLANESITDSAAYFKKHLEKYLR